MSTNFIAHGDTLQVTAPYALSSGDGCLVGSYIFGVSVADYESGDTEAQIKTTGVFDITKVTAENWTVGQKIYWHNGLKKCSNVLSSSADETLIGVAVAANTGATAGRVRLDGHFAR